MEPLGQNSSPNFFRKGITLFRHYQNPIIFILGFLFDSVTVKRIDSLLDILLEVIYIGALTILLIFQYRENHQLWRPGGWLGRVWHYNVEALHFIYGGLLSVNVILYFKSSSGAKPVVFFLFLVAMLFMNEMPQIKKFGHRLRLGLYALCVSTLMIYLVPILIGFMGDFVFLLSMGLSLGLVWTVTKLLTDSTKEPKALRIKLFLPAASVILTIVVLYFLRLIPPVPLSVQAQGIYHDIQKSNSHFILKATKPPFYLFWKKESRPFLYREGDAIFYFVRVFAPSRFKHQVMIRWERLDRNNTYVTSDRIPLGVTGGRSEGFRGTATKTNYTSGRWRVSTETEDGRTISYLTFDVQPDTEGSEREWIETQM